MASNKIIEIKHKGYLIMIRELIDEIKETKKDSTPYGIATLAFPREHLSIKDPDGKYLKEKEICKIIKRGIDTHLKKRNNCK